MPPGPPIGDIDSGSREELTMSGRSLRQVVRFALWTAAGCGQNVPRRKRPDPAPGSEIDLDEACVDLVQVAVRTFAVGSWQEHACFVLVSSTGNVRTIPFTHPLVTQLLARLRALPGFDEKLLLDVIGSRSAELVTLWAAPEPGTEPRAADPRPDPRTATSAPVSPAEFRVPEQRPAPEGDSAVQPNRPNE
jgi:hypothetical protein